MPYVVSGLVLVAALCLLDMLMTFAVLRRLREHSVRLDALPDFNLADGPGYSAKFKDRPLPDFRARTIDGTEVSPGSIMGKPGLIGVLRAGCAPCHEELPEFAALAAEGDATAISVVTGPAEDAAEMIEHLAGASVVVAGPAADTLAEALGVTVFPTFLDLDAAGVVVQAESHLSRMNVQDRAGLARS